MEPPGFGNNSLFEWSAPRIANFFLYNELTPWEKGFKHEDHAVGSPKREPIHLQTIARLEHRDL